MASSGQTSATARDGPLPDRPEPAGHHGGADQGLSHQSTQTEEVQGERLSVDHREGPDELRIQDSELWHRGIYDPENKRRRRGELGLPMSAWDRYMIRRGPRRDHGGTWVMLDSEGVHFVARDPGDGRGPNGWAEVAAQGSEEGRTQPQEGDGPRDGSHQPSLPRVEPLRLITTVEPGIALGKWCHEEEMADYLRTPGFQRGFINEAASRFHHSQGLMGLPD